MTTNPTKRHRAASVAAPLAAGLLVALALAACGGGTGPPPTQNPVPVLTSISPTGANAGDPGFTLTVTGSNFISGSQVRWGGSARTTTFVSATQLTAAISASDVAAGASVNVTVFNPTPGGGTSSPQAFTINNPAPTLTSISPTSTTAGGAAFTLTVNGTNFVSNSVVRWNGADRTTTFVGATQVTAAIPSSDIATGGTVNVTVFNPAPGGGSTGAATITINNPPPTISSLSPSSALAGSGAFTLTVNGSGFVTASTVQWKGSNRTTTFVSGSKLTAAIAASDIASAGSAAVTVVNPAPGGGTSGASNFTITSVPPISILTSVLPETTGGRDYNFTLVAAGGIAPLSWSISSGALPGGLSIDSLSGEILGTVSGVGSDTTANFTVRVTDSAFTPNSGTRALSITVHAAGTLGRNDACTAGTTAGTTQISNGRIRASISPYGDIDVYSFHGTVGKKVTIEIFATTGRLDLDGDPFNRDSYLDSMVELLDNTCPAPTLDGTSALAFSDDIDPGVVQDSLIQNFTLPYTGTYFIRVRDYRGDGRPDLIYDLSLSGAD